MFNKNNSAKYIFDRNKEIKYGEIIIAENLQNRGKYHKEYVMANGVRKLEVYATAVHYEDNNQWKEIDNTLYQKAAGINAPLTVVENDSEDGVDYSFEYTYDMLNNISSVIENYDETWSEYEYGYDEDNRLISISHDYDEVLIDYDNLGRISKIDKDYAVVENYIYNDIGTTASTNIISRFQVEAGAMYDYDYTYDRNGNITQIRETISEDDEDETYLTSYVYDSANQLIRENNQRAGKTWTYTYDAGGNITQKKEYAYTTGSTPGTVLDTINYTYGDSNWPDLLTAYDGVAFSTDAIGNLLNDGQWTYTWEHGRQLASMSKGATTLSFKYNTDGMRVEKTIGDTTWTYLYHGSDLIYMTNGYKSLKFYYESGRKIGFDYDGIMLYYVYNLQGDITAIVDEFGLCYVRSIIGCEWQFCSSIFCRSNWKFDRGERSWTFFDYI